MRASTPAPASHPTEVPEIARSPEVAGGNRNCVPEAENDRLPSMPAAGAVPAFDRTWLALVLTLQVFAGGFLGIGLTLQAIVMLGCGP